MGTVNFSVSALAKSGELLGIVGSAPEIGQWFVDGAKFLDFDSETGKWTKAIKFCEAGEVNYRYFLASKVKDSNDTDKVVVKQWEASTRKNVRRVNVPGDGNVEVDDGEFGIINGKTVLDKGWLCGQTEVRFNISQPGAEPIVSWLDPSSKNSSKSLKIQFEPDGNAFDVHGFLLKKFEHSEIETGLNVNLPKKNEEVLTYVASVMEIASFSGRFVISDDEGNVVGHVNFIGSQFHGSVGYSTQVIVDENGKPVGSFWFEYMVITTFPGQAMNMEVGYHLHWKQRPTLHIGHRGSGNSFTAETPSDIYENTLLSFKTAALHSAAMIEFDVQLTKEGIPIVFHDFTVCTSVNSKTEPKQVLHEVQVNALTYDEMQSFSTRHRSRKYGKKDPVFPEDDKSSDLRAFPTLQEVFEEVPESCGFDVELKWPHYHIDKTWYHGVREFGDANDFVDKILDVVFRCAKNRRIVFSCFEANICTMLRRKQNRYPVAFLTSGDYDTGTPFMDLRCRSNAIAVAFASSEKFLGLATLEDDAFAVPDLVHKAHNAGLKFFLYGDNITDEKNRDLLTKQGAEGIIYDRIHHVLPKGLNIFSSETQNHSS